MGNYPRTSSVELLIKAFVAGLVRESASGPAIKFSADAFRQKSS